jgi:hypothetical protein
MSYGFVYVLANSAMPGMYKIGFTERSPAKRAEELSASSGVPTPFEVVCYAEFSNCQQEESRLHAKFSKFRTNKSREFFRMRLAEIVDEFKFSEYSLSYCNVQVEYFCFLDEKRRPPNKSSDASQKGFEAWLASEQ